VYGRTNLYSVFDGRTWHTALATTEDGIRWIPRGIVLSPDPNTWEGSYIAANGSLLGDLYWYEAGPKERKHIGLARRASRWIKEPAPVLDYGPVGSFDERAVADPYVLRVGPYFYMYYLGQDRAIRQRIGLARSTDGVHWQKHRANPVLDLDTDIEAGLGEPAVWQSDGYYWMLYTVRNFDETRYLALARSTDGVHWTRTPARYFGAQSWNSKVICDPSVIVDGGTIKVWFGGGDAASPDENLHGQIGFATLVK
jgi:sucrose-6-phosphate hydrolase SacC (GH32 family)